MTPPRRAVPTADDVPPPSGRRLPERAVGGLYNIVRADSSFDTLYISLYDQSMIDTERLIRLGGVRVLETPDGVAVSCGPVSTMAARSIRNGIRSGVRDTI